MSKKHLVLLSDNYPNSDGEFFLDDEIQLLASEFKKITVLCISPKTDKSRPTPNNVSVLALPKISGMQRLFFRFKGFFFLPLWQEFFGLKTRYGIHFNFLIFKIVLEDYVRSSQIIQVLNKHDLTDPNKHILYSYWHDYKALAIARLAKQKNIKSIARGHGWDLDYKRHQPQYLPYKNFIVANLDFSISISDFGKNILQKLSNPSLHAQIIVSKLGKLNHRIPKFVKQEKNVFLICSCSNLIPLKRVESIIRFCALLELKNLKWVHFGSGEQMEELKLLVKKLQINAEFKGNTANKEILDFYHNNYVDLFINFSAWEGIPVSIMEAQSAGIPVLATAVGGTPEIVNEENGFLVDKDFDLTPTVRCILGFLQNTPENIRTKRESAYHNWNTNYNAKKNYGEFADILLNRTTK